MIELPLIIFCVFLFDAFAFGLLVGSFRKPKSNVRPMVNRPPMVIE